MKFPNVREAISYQKHCPYCKSNLEIRCKRHVGAVLQEHVPEIVDNKLLFNCLNGTIEINIETDKVKTNNVLNMDGIIFRPLRMDCASCCQYYQVFNLEIDLKRKKLISCFLNNISLKKIINNYEYSVKTSKNTDQTYFSKVKIFEEPFPPSEETLDWSNVVPPDFKFPFVKINLKNPDETILYLDQLLIFI